MKKLALILLFAASSFGQSIQERVKKFENAKAYAVEYDQSLKKTFVRYATSIKLPLFVYATIADSGVRESRCIPSDTSVTRVSSANMGGVPGTEKSMIVICQPRDAQ